MINYLKSEFYRIFHAKSTYLFIIICSALLISASILLAIVKLSEPDFPYATTYFAISLMISNVMIVYFLCITVSNMIFGNEHTNHTLKNTISYGISRSTIYFGKLIVQIVYAFLAFTLIVGCYIGSSYLLLENSGPEIMELLFKMYAAVVPMFLFALAATNCFTFIMDSAAGSIAATCGLMIGFPIVTGFLGMKFEFINKISNITPWNLIGNIDIDFENYVLTLFWQENGHVKYWIAGLAQMLIVVIVGFVVFRKKEIK
jgi:ABC-2 type transport system permease protein